MKTFKTRIVNKHAVESEWNNVPSFIPEQGEIIVYDVDANYTYERFKIGDGVTAVGNLPFINNAITMRTWTAADMEV